MPTDKQREAARINGSRSHGPITPEGKYNSSRNNLGRGLFARDGSILRDSNGRLSEYESRCDRLFLRSLERFQTFRRNRRAVLQLQSDISNPGTI